MANNFLEISKKILQIVDRYNTYKLPDPITTLSSSDIDAFASSALGYELKLYIDQVKQKGNLENIGIAGPEGDIGPKGPQGDVGDMGPQGPVGDKGPRGRDGRDGQNGKPGPDGQDGSSGESGGGALPNVFNVNGSNSNYKICASRSSSTINFNKWYSIYTGTRPYFGMVQIHLSGGNFHTHLDTNVMVALSDSSLAYFCGQMGRRSFGQLPSHGMEVHNMYIVAG